VEYEGGSSTGVRMRVRPVWLAAVVIGTLVVLAGGITWLALESAEVVVLRTRDAQGVHETRVWIADEGPFAWLEAATPEREWYLRLLADPHGEIVRSGQAHAFRAVPEPGQGGHEKIRRLLRAKYGLRDWWVGLLQDTSRSVAVRLELAE
jgi:hypothetical protein